MDPQKLATERSRTYTLFILTDSDSLHIFEQFWEEHALHTDLMCSEVEVKRGSQVPLLLLLNSII